LLFVVDDGGDGDEVLVGWSVFGVGGGGAGGGVAPSEVAVLARFGQGEFVEALADRRGVAAAGVGGDDVGNTGDVEVGVDWGQAQCPRSWSRACLVTV
jgi:hypothetical protein